MLCIVLYLILIFCFPDEEVGSQRSKDEYHTEVPPHHLHKEQRKLHLLPDKVRMKYSAMTIKSVQVKLVAISRWLLKPLFFFLFEITI